MEIDIKHIAKLSRLRVSDDELEKFETGMKSIIAMVEHMPELPDGGALIDPDHPMTLRKDIAENRYRREEILKNAPEVQAGCVVVPKVVE